MKKSSTQSGFSLAETLIALGILAVGMMFIAGAFPVAIQLTTVSVERTTAAVIAEEAFAKVKLYAKGDPVKNAAGNDDIDMQKLSTSDLIDITDLSIDAFPSLRDVGQYEFTYPSTGPPLDPNSRYCWSALCRLTGPASENPPVQVTVFVCRKTGRTLQFHKDSGGTSDWPAPCKISVKGIANNQLQLDSEKTYVNDDCTIVDDNTGQIYRVVRRLPAPNDNKVQLERAWQGGTEAWIVPPAVGGGRNPCIGVFQKEIKF